MKFAVVHPVLPAALTLPSKVVADEQLAALELQTDIPGFVRVVPDPEPENPETGLRRREHGRRSLLPRSAR